MTEPDCSVWRGVLAVRAVGMATDDEARALAGHLEHCARCRADAGEVKTAAAALSLLDAAQIDRIEGAQIDRIEAEPEVFDLSTGGRGGLQPAAGTVDAEAGPGHQRSRRKGGRRRRLVSGVAAAAVAAAIAAVVALGTSAAPPTRTVALIGEHGVRASVSLVSQTWGTRATLKESGQAAGQVLTVSMRSSSGRWWVAGSYRTTGRPGTLEVQLSCAVPANEIDDVWVSDQNGRTVLNGYVD